MSTQNDGIVVILSSPSGAGKTTLVKLISEKNNFNVSVSHTTRKPRSNEIDGKDKILSNQAHLNYSWAKQPQIKFKTNQ